ncbi:MAG: hypothetical protein JNM56_25970 [Planctomycetia bacterium]|nr:hypothetical protein [Planctomycetia bacterium]
MRVRTILILAIAAVGVVAGAQPAPPRQAVAKTVGDAGLLLRRESAAKPWQLVAAKEALSSGDVLVAGGEAALESNNGAVRVLLLGSAGGTPALPVLEAAVVLHPPAEADLDFTLLRGRVDLVHQQAKGEAKVRVRGRDGSAELRLLEPGTRVALVLAGRWPAGVPFRKDAKPETHRPALAFVLLVLQGKVEVKTPRHQFALQAPPGPALLEGDEVDETDPAPRRLDKLPDWATAKADADEVKKVQAGLKRFQQLAKATSVAEAIEPLLSAADPVERQLGVALLGATDDSDKLARLLVKSLSPDVWESGVRVSRHWIGREPGQDQKLYRALLDQKLPAAQAETVLQLLHSFGNEALMQPETYEGLIDLLDSDQAAIRGLAYWHLYRLAPAGRKLGYDPLAAPEKRAAAVQAWRQLIPAGQLPPAK